MSLRENELSAAKQQRRTESNRPLSHRVLCSFPGNAELAYLRFCWLSSLPLAEASGKIYFGLNKVLSTLLLY